MKIFSIGSNPQKNINQKKENRPSFKSDLLFSDGAKLLLEKKIPEFYKRCNMDEKKQFFEGFIDVEQAILNLESAFYEQTKEAKGLVTVARELDPEYEESLRVLYLSPDKKLKRIGYMSIHEILPNKYRDGAIPFGNTIKMLVGSINSALMLGPRSNESIAFAKIHETLGKSGSELISEL